MKHPRLRFPCRDVINIIIRLLGNESLYEYERPAATLLRRITAANNAAIAGHPPSRLNMA